MSRTRVDMSSWKNASSSILSASVCYFGIAISVGAQAPQHLCTYQFSREEVSVSGHEVTVEYYQPNGPGPFPLVFMLHGSAGAFTSKSSSEPSTDDFGEKELARSCFLVALPHYLEAIGRESIYSSGEMTARFPEIIAAGDLLLKNAEAIPTVKGQAVFLFGESLGGYIAVALALRRPEVTAVSEFGGGRPSGYSLERTHGPAVLISHGDADNIVPESEARVLRTYCMNHHMTVETKLYGEEGHYLSSLALRDIVSRTIAFFRANLCAPGRVVRARPGVSLPR